MAIALLTAQLQRKFKRSSAIVVQAKKSMWSPSITHSLRKQRGGASGSVSTVVSNTSQRGGTDEPSAEVSQSTVAVAPSGWGR